MNGKIILIEDELFLKDLYQKVLAHAGYTVLEASDGEEGLKIVHENPDAKVILLDIMLPKKHGVDVLRELKSAPSVKDIPVIILSNLTDESVIRETMSIGAKGYFVKVRVGPDKLVEKVRECIAEAGTNGPGKN